MVQTPINPVILIPQAVSLPVQLYLMQSVVQVIGVNSLYLAHLGLDLVLLLYLDIGVVSFVYEGVFDLAVVVPHQCQLVRVKVTRRNLRRIDGILVRMKVHVGTEETLRLLLHDHLAQLLPIVVLPLLLFLLLFFPFLFQFFHQFFLADLFLKFKGEWVLLRTL